MEKNSLFYYATKELSQDAFFCWLINWINYPKTPMYAAGVAALNLFLGKNKQDAYQEVEVKRQYKKIDVLILFNGRYALIIEDKTDTSEHGDQIARYKERLQDEYPEREIFTAYVKTGIMYDEDRMTKADTTVELEDLLRVLTPYREISDSEIFCDYVDHISRIKGERDSIDALIAAGNYEAALQTAYGQFSFLNQVFPDRKPVSIGKRYKEAEEKKKNKPIYCNWIYAGTNKGGSPWSQYCFWGKAYESQLRKDGEIEYQYLFWRVDYFTPPKGSGLKGPQPYIALRHYDDNAKRDDETKKRKGNAYNAFYRKYAAWKDKWDMFNYVGTRENYKESDILFIPLYKISDLSIEEIRYRLDQITGNDCVR